MTRERQKRTLYTVGHSTHTAPELIDMLRAFEIVHLVDIRSIPRSRTNPQFDVEPFRSALRGAKIGYTHLEALGGRRPKSKVIADDVNAGWRVRAFHNYADYAETPDFEAGLQTLLELAARETCVIMCAEAVWWRCHRRIVTDYALAHGVPVVHVFNATKSEPALLTPFAVVTQRARARARVSYPASAGSTAAIPSK